MTTFVRFEPLEGRRYYAARVDLDPDYLFTAQPLTKRIGQNAAIYQALAGPHDRTYLLAERYDDRSKPIFSRPGFLTIIAVRSDGRLDPLFGNRGIVKSDEATQSGFQDASGHQLSGLLRLDDAGRLYFATNTRVLRFDADGTVDTTFGHDGAIAFAPAGRPVRLCDIAPTDDGVLIATTQTVDGVQRFAVQKADRGVRTVWQATHDTGVPNSENAADFTFGANAAQFTRVNGRIVLARVQRDNDTYPYHSADEDSDNDVALGVSRQVLIATRFDASGHGTDVLRATLSRPDAQGQPGTEPQGQANLGGVALRSHGRVLIAQTDRELLRMDLNAGSARRYALPGQYTSDPGGFRSFTLLSNGDVATVDERSGKDHLGRTQQTYYDIQVHEIDGTAVTRSPNDGVLTVTQDTFSGPANNYVKQVFLGNWDGDPDGDALYFYAINYNSVAPALTLRRD